MRAEGLQQGKHITTGEGGVVTTDDVTLVCPAERAQDVKLALGKLTNPEAKSQT